jgi:tRNA dimethylallyltransferase
MSKAKVLVLTGPTAIGKSAIAINVAHKLNGEIISADSMQVYKDMDIGTAKPSIQELKEVSHHLIDIVEPDKEFSVVEYQRKARQEIENISNRGKLAILVGGSGLYVRAVIDRLEFPQGKLDSKIRKKLEEELQEIGSEALYEKLKKLDLKAAACIHPRNTRRIIRALEVIESTGHLFSDFQKEWNKRESIYDVQIIALNLPRDELYAKIDERVNKMISDGLIDETKSLFSQGYGKTITSKQALGYRQILDYLEEKISLEECISLIKQKTRHFAKRQMTWLRRDPRIFWMDISGKDPTEVASEIMDYLKAKKFIS